ncbi:hypothetical protein O9H85_14340 [Paenibacillus filicis]|uniref:Exosporium protein C n=1 Tax=Paenibacillus gyeongsangnamensis TaxID=3388067 RepID=A0ABT4QA07_9BACL|nr:hypothetical protein [Paenibacillus filicis]MCZ8513592.1 hypothetical protein [Paenibacillus filicis]
MPFTTGLITNTSANGTAASTVVFNVLNADPVFVTIVHLQIFGVLNTDVPRIPLHNVGYQVLPNTVSVKTFSIGGFFAYEVQFNVIARTNLGDTVSIFGLDASGNLVTGQRYIQSEFKEISQLTTIP